jgi:hypothetical protein
MTAAEGVACANLAAEADHRAYALDGEVAGGIEAEAGVAVREGPNHPSVAVLGHTRSGRVGFRGLAAAD